MSYEIPGTPGGGVHHHSRCCVASCAETASEPGGVPSNYQTVDEFMGRDMDDQDAESQAYADLRNRIEAMLVECMAGRGLEYAPYEGPTGDLSGVGCGVV